MGGEGFTVILSRSPPPRGNLCPSAKPLCQHLKTHRVLELPSVKMVCSVPSSLGVVLCLRGSAAGLLGPQGLWNMWLS